MKYLLDTHILLWYLTDNQEKLSAEYIEILLNEQNELYFSSVSIWEIAIKSGLNKADFRFKSKLVCDELLRQGFNLLDLKVNHIYYLEQLPSIHQDPFDRLLIAQAYSERLTLLTLDQKILQYPKQFIANSAENLQ